MERLAQRNLRNPLNNQVFFRRRL